MPFTLKLEKLSEPLPLLVLVQSGLLIIGISGLNFSVNWTDVAVTVATAATAELFLRWLFNKPFSFPLSAIAAGLGISIFLRASSVWFFAGAALIAIVSKYVFITGSGRHIFNPSNLGVLAIVFTFSANSTIEFTQWGGDLFLQLTMSAAILAVAWRARVLPTTIAFIVSYTCILIFLLPFAPDRLSVHHYGLISPSLVLFAAFMITDPKTSPIQFPARVYHGVSVAMIYFVLELLGVRYALFLASLVVTIFNLFSNSLYKYVPGSLARVIRTPNTYTCFVSLILLLFSGVQLTSNNSMLYQPFRIAPSFVFNGIESGQLLTCSEYPTFRDQASNAGLESTNGSFISGAAWGDYDNDGDDDLFISSIDKPARLFQNNSGSFIDVTVESGISTVYPSSAYFADFDNDSDLDLFLSGPLITSRNVKRLSYENELSLFMDAKQDDQLLQVYENNNGNFTDVTNSLIDENISIGNYWSFSGMTFADFDNDSDLDFIVTFKDDVIQLPFSDTRSALAKSLFDPFFQNANTISCNPSDLQEILSPYVARNLLTQSDIDNYIGNRGCASVYHDLPMYKSIDGNNVDSLENFSSSPYMLLIKPGFVYLFENNGDMFSKHDTLNELSLLKLPVDRTTTKEPMQVYGAVSGQFYQPAVIDYNNDGLLDIFLAIDFGSNLLFENIGNLQFADKTAEVGINRNGTGMGVSVGDINNDTLSDIIVTNVLDDYIFLGNMDGKFLPSNQNIGKLGVGWGVAMLDYDLNGWSDILIVNGDMGVTQDIPLGTVGRPLFRSNLLYKNLSGDLHQVTGTDFCPNFQSSKALAVSDYDVDGDPDVFIGNRPTHLTSNVTNVLYENTITEKNYLRIDLSGRESNSYGVGAKIEITTESGQTQTRRVTIGDSFYSQHSLTQLFGFGEETRPVQIKVFWPSGIVDEFENIELNQTLQITESSDTI